MTLKNTAALLGYKIYKKAREKIKKMFYSSCRKKQDGEKTRTRYWKETDTTTVPLFAPVVSY